jgi:hypothetical protein
MSLCVFPPVGTSKPGTRQDADVFTLKYIFRFNVDELPRSAGTIETLPITVVTNKVFESLSCPTQD